MPPVSQNQGRAPAPAQTKPQEQPKGAPGQQQPENEFQKLLRKDHKVEYKPFGSDDPIKLTVSIVTNLICVPTRSGHRCSENDALKFIAMCQAKRLNPFEGDCYMLGYDTQSGPQFSQITAHQVYLKRAELHPEYDGMESGLIVMDIGEDKQPLNGNPYEIQGDFYLPQQRVLGGWCKVHFKNRKHPMYKRLRLDRFNTGKSIWADDAAGMICKCAEADALRSSFPTMLGGLYLREEMSQPQPAVVAPDFKPADILGKPALFSVPGQVKPEAVPPPADDAKPEPKPEEKPAPAAPAGPLVELRQLLAGRGIPEANLVNYLIEVGSVSDSVTALDEVALVSPEIIGMLVSNFEAAVVPNVPAK